MNTDMKTALRSSFLKDIMSPRMYGKVGGPQKRNFLRTKEVPEVEHVPNINKLLYQLIRLFASRYKEPPVVVDPDDDVVNIIKKAETKAKAEAIEAKDTDINMDTADDAGNAGDKDPNNYPNQESNAKEDLDAVLLRGLKDHHAVIVAFEHFLHRHDWPEDDEAKPQSKMLSQDEKRGMRAGSAKSKSVAEENGVFVQ
jgi:hypothetical protein